MAQKNPEVNNEHDALTRALLPLARLLVPIVAAELSRSATAAGHVYSVKRPLPGCSARWMRSHVAKMPGAFLAGGAWHVSRADGMAYLEGLSAARRAKRRAARQEAAAAALPADGADVAAWVEAAGLRVTR